MKEKNNHFNKVMCMKKIFGVIALAAGFLFAAPAQAQFKFGVKAGLNVSKAILDKEVVSADNRNGFFIGPVLEFTVPVIGIGLDAALLYDNKSIKASGEDLSGNNVSQTETLHYIDIPVNVKYTIGLGSLASVYGATGPQFSYNVGGKSVFDNMGDYTLNKSEFSWNVGAGVKLLGHLQVGYNYNIALGNTAEVKEKGAAGTAVGYLLGKKVKNNTHQISVAYMF